MTAITARVEPILVRECLTQPIAFEQRFEMKSDGSTSLVDIAARGGQDGSPSRGKKCGGPGGAGQEGFTRGGGGHNVGGRGPNFQVGVFCQIYGNEGHLAHKCYKHYNSNYSGPPPHQKTTALATSLYGVDINWYMDSGATDHVTGELEKLTVRDRYNRQDQIHIANGVGMDIHHVGSSALHAQNHAIHHKNILHVPSAHKNLCSMNR